MAALPYQNKQDSEKFGFEQEDVGIRSEMEGGYVLTRPRHTRTPRRTWTVGFTDLSNDEKLVIEAFWNEHGTYKAFDYTDPTTGEMASVRFAAKFSYKYSGKGNNFRWDINDMKLEEV